MPETMTEWDDVARKGRELHVMDPSSSYLIVSKKQAK